MAVARKDIIGNKYNKLIVLEYSHTRKEVAYWKCLCECGKEKVINGVELKRGGVKSCGCLCAINGLKRRKPKPIKEPKEIKGRLVKCGTCNVVFFRNNCFINDRNFCSRKCHHKHLDKGKYLFLDCDICNKNYKVSQSYFNARGRKYCSVKCSRIGLSKTQSGPNSRLWKGGKSYAGKRIRKGVEWKMWREEVFKRDNYTCQDCGARSGKGCKVELHPHHIKQFALYPELRFEPSNGLTLCKECHKKTDTYLKPPKKNIQKSNGKEIR